MSVRIFTITHKQFDVPANQIYIPLQVGKANSVDLGYLADDTGDTISAMNCYYSELTGVYWIWKNYKDSDYVGVCHYRRYLINDKGELFTESEFEEILKKFDIITSKKLKYEYSYYDGYADGHTITDLIETGKVIQELYPEYYNDFERLVHANESYFGNIMVTSKKLFDEYASWLFSILFEVQKRIDVSSYDEYHKRVFGFISEFLLLVWVTTNKLKPYECMVGMTTEKYETKEMKKKLAWFFEKKDIQGAKIYFTESLEKRPDVLMQASDTTGELKLAMQVITTCDNEYKNNLKMVVEEINDFKQLITYFKNLNTVVERYKLNEEQEEDITYLCTMKISYIAIEIAVMILCQNPQIAVTTLQKIASAMEKRQMTSISVPLREHCHEIHFAH